MSRTRPFIGALAIIAVMTLTAAPAAGQTLEERIAQVRKRQAEERARTRMGSERLVILQKLLYTDLTVDFDEAPARDVFEFLRTALDVNLVARYADDPAGHGIDPQEPVTLSVQRMPAVDLLELVLEQCAVVEECTWQLRGSYLEVGTKERLSTPAARFTRVYPVHDLLYRAPRFDDAPPLGIVPALPYADGGGYGGYGGFRGTLSGGFGSGGRVSGSMGGGTYGAGSLGGGSGYGDGSDDPNAINSPEQLRARGNALIEMITESVEPGAWTQMGGDWASIQLVEGDLVVNAPDYIQRQIGGYPRVPPPATIRPASAPATP